MNREAMQSIRFVLAQVALLIAEHERDETVTVAEAAVFYAHVAEALRGLANVLDELSGGIG